MTALAAAALAAGAGAAGAALAGRRRCRRVCVCVCVCVCVVCVRVSVSVSVLCVFVVYCNTPENELTGEARAASNHEYKSSFELVWARDAGQIWDLGSQPPRWLMVGTLTPLRRRPAR